MNIQHTSRTNVADNTVSMTSRDKVSKMKTTIISTVSTTTGSRANVGNLGDTNNVADINGIKNMNRRIVLDKEQ